MDNFRYYLSIFLRRLPWFLVIATILSAVSVTVAMTLPPAYVSQMKLLVEPPRIPTELASSVVQTPPQEQLQLIEQKLLTRENMLTIARRLQVLKDIDKMNPDEIVDAMRARTTIALARGRNPLPLMEVRFEAPNPRVAAGVLNEYLSLIQQEDAEFRRGRTGETLAFFEAEVARLATELDTQSARILAYKQENSGALPDSLDFRMRQQSDIQDQVRVLAREIAGLQDQRKRLIQLFEQTGGLAGPTAEIPLTADEQRLAELRRQLADALVVFAPENPRVKVLQARIAQLEESVAAAAAAPVPTSGEAPEAPMTPERTRAIALEIQLAEIDARIQTLERQKAEAEARLAELTETIERTPEVTIALEELERKYELTKLQFSQAEQRLSKAQTGERIETNSRGERISVIEQPAVPSQPTKPSRLKIAGGGSALGIAAGLALILILEMLNNTARRPEDLVARFGITPLTTIPYIRSRTQTFVQRSLKLLLIAAILVGIPAAIFAVHTYYLPLDLLADKIMNKLGVRW